MRRDHQFQCVRRVPLFAGLPEDIQRQVADTAVTRSYRPGEHVYAPGHALGLFIVHCGQVKVYRLTESGSQQLIRLMSPGDFLGETALLAGTTSDHFAEAVRPSEVCILAREPVNRLLSERAEVALRMLRAVSERLGTAEQKLSSLTGHSVGQRLAQQLLHLAGEAESLSFRLPTTKKDLASYLGTTAETLSRRLATLQDSGVIRLGAGRTIEILDPDELQKLASS